MTAWIWGAAAVAAVTAVASGSSAAVRAVATWRAFRRLERRLGEALDAVARRVERSEGALAAAADLARRLDRARADLRRSVAVAAVLASALGEVRALLRRVTG